MRNFHSLTIETLLGVPGSIHVDVNSVILDSTKIPQLSSLTNIWKDVPIHIDCVMVALCTEGELDVSISFKKYKLVKNTVCILTPESVLEILDIKPDFHCLILAFTRGFVDIELNTTVQMMQLFKYVHNEPCIQLEGQYAEHYNNAVICIMKTVAWTDNPLRNRMMQSYLFVLFCCVYPIISKDEKGRAEDRLVSAQNRVFISYIELLQSNYKEHRTVAFYAEKLGMTPKYLSKLTLSETGQSALRWIEYYVLLEAKALLKQNNDTILSVSKKLNFTSQGSFGKFFHRLTGMSPKEYRDIKQIRLDNLK